MGKKLNLIGIIVAIILPMSIQAQEHDFETFEKNTINGKKVGVINKKSGKEVLSANYDDVMDFFQGRFFVKANGKFGVVDTLGKTIIPIIYDEVGYLEDRAFVKKANKWAMFEYQKGTAMTAFIYDDILGYQDGVARITQKEKIGYIDKFGKTILACKFSEGYDCWGEFILVYENSFVSTGYKYVTKNSKGDVTSKQEIGYSGKKPIVFNKKGEIVYMGKQYEKVVYNSGKSVFVVKDGGSKEKLLDINGNELFSYSSNYYFKDVVNWIKFYSTDGVGLLNLKGEMILKPVFDEITDYDYANKSLAKVFFKNRQFFYIDLNGNCNEFEGIKCPQ